MDTICSGAKLMKSSSKLSLKSYFAFILLHAALLIVILAIGRLLLVNAYALPGELDGHGKDVWAMWNLGIRYDIRTIIYGILPMFLLGIAACFSGYATWAFSWLQRIYSPFLYLAFSVATVTNFYYYRTFQKEIDVMVFGLKDDDTRAVISSVMNDYPFFRVVLLVLIVTLFFSWLTRRIWYICYRWSCTPEGEVPHVTTVITIAARAALLFGFTLLTFLGARGTLHHIPLRQRDRSVSQIPLLNNAVPNALLAFNWAWNNYLENPGYPAVDPQEGQEFAMRLFGKQDLAEKTAENIFLEKNPPHVVLSVVEGLGSNLLEFDRPGEVDLLGSLRSHAEGDFFFKRFLAENFRTMAALTRILFYCPDMDVTKGLFKKIKLDNSAFDIYKQNGYETVFIHTGLTSWWDMQAYLDVQGVDRTFFSDDFLQRYDDAKLNIASGSWGLPDEFAYRLALELLEQSSKPMFIVIMTLSNHSPFNVPPGYVDRYPVNPNRDVLDSFFEREGATRKILTGYQYAANCLGDFIAAVKKGQHGDSTLIAATGDHASAQIKAAYPGGLFLNKASPYYLYVPKPILEHTKHLYDPMRVGSHKDIMPTLYSMSLSGAAYFTVGGRNMLAVQDDPARAFGYNIRLYMNNDGACAIGDDFSDTWHVWDEGALRPDSEAIPPSIAEKISKYEKLYRWQINARIGGLVPNK